MRSPSFLLTFAMTILYSVLGISTVSAEGKSHDNFYPVGRVVVTPVFLTERVAFSALAEGGPKSYRFNGTIGGITSCNQHRFKAGGEYLSQKIRFKFESGREHRWINQWAVGGKYQYVLEDDCYCDWLKSLDLSAYYANAKSKDLGEVQEGDTLFQRRVVGGRGWGIEAGTSLDTCWNDGVIFVGIDYDSFEFKKHFSHHKTISGVGATLALNQPLWCDVVFDFKYQYKRVYDYVGGLLRWTNNLECGDLTLGIFANHVFGKKRVPSSTTAGIQVGFSFGMDSLFGDCFDSCATDCCPADCNDLAAWISDPAVYMPQVIAIGEERESLLSVAAPQEAEAAPQQAEAAPQQAEAAPQQVEAAPQEVEAVKTSEPLETNKDGSNNDSGNNSVTTSNESDQS